MPASEHDEAGSKRPARGLIPDGEVRFARKAPNWKLWIPVVAVVVGMVVAYFVTEARKTTREREALLREHALLTESLAPAYRATREHIERLVHGVIGPWQGTYTAPGFTIADLQRSPVLYGRVRLGEIHRVEDVAASIRHRYPDQVADCMGLETSLVNEYYRSGEFLMPSYVDSVRGERSGDRLRVLRDDLQFRLRRDTHDLVEWSRRRYLMVAVDEAAVATQGPTRVYVWDFADDRVVLRTRAEGDSTVIIPVRIAGMPGGGRAVPQPNGDLTQSQHDCAVASVARQQLGAPSADMPNAPQQAVGAPDGGSALPAGDAAAPGATTADANGVATTGTGAATTSASPAATDVSPAATDAGAAGSVQRAPTPPGPAATTPRPAAGPVVSPHHAPAGADAAATPRSVRTNP